MNRQALRALTALGAIAAALAAAYLRRLPAPSGAPQDAGRAGPPPQTKGKTEMQTLTVPANKEKLAEVTDFVDAFLEAHGASMKAQMLVDLCVEEVFVNIASYAYPRGEGEAELRLSEQDGAVTLTFLDSGVPYDPLAKPDPDVTLSAAERPVGGLGIFLVKKNVDHVSYRYENGRNVLTMIKKL